MQSLFRRRHRPRIELHQFQPVDLAIVLAILVRKVLCQEIDLPRIRSIERNIPFFGSVPERLDDIGKQMRLTGDELPE